MAEDYILEQGIDESEKAFPLDRKNLGEYNYDNVVSYSGVNSYPGLSAADPENPYRPRKREEYLEKVLNPMIERGEIGDGVKSKWDDRKFRFDRANSFWSKDRGDELDLKLGITYFQECADCRTWDEKKRVKMVREGEKRFNDPYAFFTRGCGIEATPITSEGHIFAGKRKAEEEGSGYDGELGAVNGWINYKGLKSGIFYQHLIDVDFRKDVLREMGEEFGIKPEDIEKLIFAGVVSAPNMADTDFVYLAPLKINDEEFLKRYETRQDEEHEENLRKIVNYGDIQMLLETGKLPGYEEKFDLVYSLRASLEQIRPDEMA